MTHHIYRRFHPKHFKRKAEDGISARLASAISVEGLSHRSRTNQPAADYHPKHTWWRSQLADLRDDFVLSTPVSTVICGYDRSPHIDYLEQSRCLCASVVPDGFPATNIFKPFAKLNSTWVISCSWHELLDSKNYPETKCRSNNVQKCLKLAQYYIIDIILRRVCLSTRLLIIWRPGNLRLFVMDIK